MLLSSVCLSVCLWHYVLWRSGSEDGVESCTLAYVFLGRNFLFTSSGTFAVGFIVQPQNTVKIEPLKFPRLEQSWVTWPWLFQTRHFRQFIAAAIPPVRSALFSDSNAI